MITRRMNNTKITPKDVNPPCTPDMPIPPINVVPTPSSHFLVSYLVVRYTVSYVNYPRTIGHLSWVPDIWAFAPLVHQAIPYGYLGDNCRGKAAANMLDRKSCPSKKKTDSKNGIDLLCSFD